MAASFNVPLLEILQKYHRKFTQIKIKLLNIYDIYICGYVNKKKQKNRV